MTRIIAISTKLSAFWRELNYLWLRVPEPREIALYYFIAYSACVVVGFNSLVSPPMTLQGELGLTTMRMLSSVLAIGGVLGAFSAFPGVYWLERFGISFITLAASTYLVVILTLHFTSPGNRLLQGLFVFLVLVHQRVRWVRIRTRPYRPQDDTSAEIV